MKRGAVYAALPRTSVFPKTIIAFCRYIADHTAVTMIATSNTQKRPWPTVCTHGGCNTPWWHDGVPAKHSVGMRVTSEEKPRQAATVIELMAEQRRSQTRMRSCAYLGSR